MCKICNGNLQVDDVAKSKPSSPKHAICLQKYPHPTARPVDKCDVQWFSVQEYRIINKKDFALSETPQ